MKQLLLVLAAVSLPVHAFGSEPVAKQTFLYLNAPNFEITPGQICIVDSGTAAPLIDMLRSAPLDSLPGWIEQSEPIEKQINIPLGQLQVETILTSGGSQHFLTRCFRPLSVRSSTLKGVVLNDVSQTLDLINRPLTGLEYNRHVESRILQWRRTLANAQLSCVADGKKRLAICTSVLSLDKAELFVSARQFTHEGLEKSLDHFVLGTTLSVGHTERRATINGVATPINTPVIAGLVYHEIRYGHGEGREPAMASLTGNTIIISAYP